MVGTKVPFAQVNPRLGLSACVAFMQITLGVSKLCGKTSMFDISKFLHEVLVLHSTIMASVCVRLGRPTSYQQGYNAKSTKAHTIHWTERRKRTYIRNA